MVHEKWSAISEGSWKHARQENQSLQTLALALKEAVYDHEAF